MRSYIILFNHSLEIELLVLPAIVGIELSVKCPVIPKKLLFVSWRYLFATGFIQDCNGFSTNFPAPYPKDDEPAPITPPIKGFSSFCYRKKIKS